MLVLQGVGTTRGVRLSGRYVGGSEGRGNSARSKSGARVLCLPSELSLKF